MAGHSEDRPVATNRKALHDYFVLETMEAGLVLKGTEVKSLREGKANLTDSYVLVREGEAFLLNAHISPYSHGNIENHDPTRSRKLLLHRHQIRKLDDETTRKGLTIVPLKLYFRDGRAKAEIALVRGKKLFDKRETEKRKEAERESAAAIKSARR
ncbi:MAG TPA: SsrA-binding protein SmpB [Thermoanaerobaculia bacterium]|nr:SsrA-binding protein SmpB [Thermoanaerobaculia bacterium]